MAETAFSRNTRQKGLLSCKVQTVDRNHSVLLLIRKILQQYSAFYKQLGHMQRGVRFKQSSTHVGYQCLILQNDRTGFENRKKVLRAHFN